MCSAHCDFRSSSLLALPVYVRTQLVVATFSAAMNPATINSTTFTLTAPGTPPVAVAGTVSYDAASDAATFTPTSPLALNTLYTATITTGAQDLAGDPLASDYVWTFTTSVHRVSQARGAVGNRLHVWNSGRLPHGCQLRSVHVRYVGISACGQADCGHWISAGNSIAGTIVRGRCGRADGAG
jgi:hypothetical protein